MAGDTNINLIDFDNNNVNDYLTTLLMYKFIPMITLPIRITDHSATCIDHIFVKIPIQLKQTKLLSGIFYSDINDHLPCFIHIDLSKPKTQPRPFIRIFSEDNFQNFKHKLENIDWNELFQPDIDWYQVFIDKVQNAFYVAFPLVKLSRKRSKDKPWITKGIKTSILRKNSMYKSLVRNKNNINKCEYRAYCNKLTKIIRQAEIMHYNEILYNHHNSAQMLWKYFGKSLNPRRIRRKDVPNRLLYEDKIHSGSQNIADCFNDFFCTVGKKLSDKIEEDGMQGYRNYMKYQCQNSFFLSAVTYEEVLWQVKNLDSKKTCGPDGIGPKIIKSCPELFANLLNRIFNNAIENGIYPNAMKIARILAIFKKGSKEDPNNYRPISLLSCFNKIFERLLHKQLMNFLKKHKSLFKYQFGFRPKHSTADALINITDNIKDFMDKGNYVLGLFLDLKKAFDTVDHQILLDKLETIGIRGHALQFFNSYLTDRKQFVIINGKNSKTKYITTGVPQGSVLGPLFFLIYINDIQYACNSENIRLFADDTSYFLHDKKLENLMNKAKQTVTNLQQWLSANKLNLNIDKTIYVIFRNNNKQMGKFADDLQVGNNVFEREKSCQYIGMMLDEKMNWDEHINNVKSKLIKYFAIFNYMKTYVSKQLARQLYYAFIFPHINYGIERYGASSSGKVKQIQVIQNKLKLFKINS